MRLWQVKSSLGTKTFSSYPEASLYFYQLYKQSNLYVEIPKEVKTNG